MAFILRAYLGGINLSLVFGKQIDLDGVFFVQNQLPALGIRFSCDSHMMGLDDSQRHSFYDLALGIFQQYLKLALVINDARGVWSSFLSFLTVVSPNFIAVTLLEALSKLKYSGSLTSKVKSASSPTV